MFAERQHDEPGVGLDVRCVGIERKAPCERIPAQEKGKRGRDRSVGETCQRLGRLDDVPYAAEVGERDQ